MNGRQWTLRVEARLPLGVQTGRHRAPARRAGRRLLGGRRTGGTGIGEFSTPRKLALDRDDNVYVLDRANKRFHVFDKQLTFLSTYGNPAWNPWDQSESP
jgi:hypothetical protein